MAHVYACIYGLPCGGRPYHTCRRHRAHCSVGEGPGLNIQGGESHMLKIRLTRLGAKKAPYYRIVVADSRAPREGRPVDTIGAYDATKSPAMVSIDEEKAIAWLGKGAQPTDTVRSLLKQEGVTAKFAAAKK